MQLAQFLPNYSHFRGSGLEDIYVLCIIILCFLIGLFSFSAEIPVDPSGAASLSLPSFALGLAAVAHHMGLLLQEHLALMSSSWFPG